MALKQKIYETKAEKKKDFWLGVGLWFGLNILMGLCSWGLNYVIFAVIPFIVTWDVSNLFAFYSQFSWVIGFLALAINIGLLIYFGATRSQIALGMLAGFGIAFLITICLGVIFTAWCFYVLSSGGY